MEIKQKVPSYDGGPDIHRWADDAWKFWAEYDIRTVRKDKQKNYQFVLEAILQTLFGFTGAAADHAEAEEWYE